MVDYDLHIHSNYSDGIFTTKKIFELASERGLKGLSLTDHDTVMGLDECKDLSREYGIDFIPGIELGTYNNYDEIHILGYYIDYKNLNFLRYLNEFQEQRFKRANKMIGKLNSIGYSIALDEVLENMNDDSKSIGRPHIARALVDKGYFKNITEVFDKLIGNGGPAYVERFKISVKEGIELIKNVDGIPVLAHPALNKNLSRGREFESFIEKLTEYGLEGIEVYHSRHSKTDSVYYDSIANRYNLIATGGSDCHGSLVENEILLGRKGIPEFYIKKMKHLKGIKE